MATTAAEMVIKLKEIMASSPGVSEITVDGIRVRVDLGALDYWERRATQEESPSTRPVSATIDLSGF